MNSRLRGGHVMNFDEYQGKGQTRYAEFADIVRDILEKAINSAEGVSRPQSIQCRTKEASHLKPKLEARGLLQSSSVEDEIKDLAGVRLIFYTNTDVDRILNSCLIPENFVRLGPYAHSSPYRGKREPALPSHPLHRQPR